MLISTKSCKKTMLTSLKIFFLVSQLGFGINFGYTSIMKSKFRVAIHRLTTFISLVWVVIYLGNTIYLVDDPWCWLNTAKYILFFFILNKLPYSICDLFTDLNKICEMTEVDNKYLNAIAIGYWLLMDLIKGSLNALRCALEIKPYCSKFGSLTSHFIFIAGVLGLDALGVGQTLIYYFMKCCIQNVKECFKGPDLQLKHFERKYTAIAECYKKIRPLYDAMILLQLGIMVPKLMGTFWSAMLYFNAHGGWLSCIAEITFAFHMITHICTPAIVVEMVNSQVDSIKQILKEKLLEINDERKIAEVNHTLQLLDTKRLNHLVLRFIPIDLRLLWSLFSFCSTYFIVVIQFSHLYG